MRASSARKRQCSGFQTNLLDRILKAAERELLALYREKAERVGHGETPGVGCTDAEMNSSLGTNRRKYGAYMVRGGPKAPAARYIWSLYFRVERVSMIRGFLHQALVMKATRP